MNFVSNFQQTGYIVNNLSVKRLHSTVCMLDENTSHPLTLLDVLIARVAIFSSEQVAGDKKGSCLCISPLHVLEVCLSDGVDVLCWTCV